MKPLRLKDLPPKARKAAIAAGATPDKGVDKFGAKPTTIDGVRFDSATEAHYVSMLKMIERGGAIRDLALQPVFDLVVNNILTGAPVKVGVFTADAAYVVVDPRSAPQPGRQAGERVVLDVKSKGTQRERDYRLRKRLFEALHGIALVEVVL